VGAGKKYNFKPKAGKECLFHSEIAGKRSDFSQKGWIFFLRGVVTLTINNGDTNQKSLRSNTI